MDHALTNQRRVAIKLLAPDAKIPRYATAEAAGADLHAYLADGRPVRIAPGERFACPTGIALQLPPGLEGQIRARSGLAINNGITVLNGIGSLDSDYRGEVKVILINHSKVTFQVESGDRIAQLVIAPVLQADFESVQELDQTKRGDGGFGSTGIR